MPTLGPFHRRETPEIQTSELAILQVKTGEIWGRTPKNGGNWPTVQAYTTPIGSQRGREFTTEIAPMPHQAPLEARWYLGLTPGVQARRKDGEDFACITAVVKNFQP